MTRGGEVVHLTPTEFALLRELGDRTGASCSPTPSCCGASGARLRHRDRVRACICTPAAGQAGKWRTALRSSSPSRGPGYRFVPWLRPLPSPGPARPDRSVVPVFTNSLIINICDALFCTLRSCGWAYLRHAGASPEDTPASYVGCTSHDVHGAGVPAPRPNPAGATIGYLLHLF